METDPVLGKTLRCSCGLQKHISSFSSFQSKSFFRLSVERVPNDSTLSLPLLGFLCPALLSCFPRLRHSIVMQPASVCAAAAVDDVVGGKPAWQTQHQRAPPSVTKELTHSRSNARLT